MLAAFGGGASLFTAATPECASASLVSASVPASATGGAPTCIDFSGSIEAGSTWYSTSMRSSASSAMASSSAATAATGWPTKTTRSMASTAWARVGAFFLSCGRSAAVRTASTPGRALALLVSMRTILAWACGLRRSFASSMPRGLMSATYWTCPVTLSAPSARGMDTPTPLISRVVFMIAMASSLSSGCGGRRRLRDGGHHGRVSGAAAQISGDAVADLLLGGVRVLGEKSRGRHQYTGDAEAALRYALAHEGFLERGERAGGGEALDGAN